MRQIEMSAKTVDEAVLAAAGAAPHHIVVRSKSDLPAVWDMDGAVAVSALTGAGLDELEAAVAALFKAADPLPAGETLTNPRQADAVGRALDYVKAAKEAMTAGFAPDAVLTEVEGALSALGELSGRTVREDVTNGIFSRFCVGK